MDVLFNSIDVRDLLSVPDVDDVSAPLSAPDLRLLIDRLQLRSVDIKSKVRHYIISHHTDFSALFSQCSDVVSRSEHLSDRVSDLLRLISDRPVEVTTKAVIDEIVAKRREMREKRDLLEFLGVVLELSGKLELVKEELKAGNVENAAAALRDLKAALLVSENDVPTEKPPPLVYDLLKNQWTECFEEIQELLLKCIEDAVRFEHEGHTVRVKHHTSIHEIELPTILKAMEAIGIMDYGLAKIADSMIKTIVTPVVVNWSTTTFHVEEKTKESGHCADSVLRIVSSTDHKIDCSSGEAMYSTLIQIVKFINESLCFQNDAWMHCFGRLTWPRMSELIISNFLSKLVPDDASKLADFQKLVKHTSEFETILKDLKFISSDSKDERLSRFADNVEVHFASRKKVEILTKARNVLLQSDFRFREQDSVKGTQVKDEENRNTTCDHVVDLLFSSEKCMVSEAALQLMKLVHQTLKDVCLSSPRVGVEFYQAARDSLLLYEAILPVKLEKQLDSINHAAVLIHNDCLYLSQEILGLAFEYRSNFPSFIKELAVFVDLAPRFQMMAEEVLQRQIQLVIVNLKQAIDGADGFQNTHLVKHYESAKLSIDQVVFILEKVHIVWKSLMLPSTYKRSMSMFLEEIFSRIAKDILLLDDMAAEETLQLQRLIHLLFENLQPFLEFLLDLIQREKLRDYPIQTIDDLIPSLRKLKKLADLLDMPLKSITESWESGELVICGFTSSEVQDFIRAIFTQSTLRKECLHRIESTAFG
nr:centromere/kinetochore protein zw10 homolog isoform X1 [Ipomoea batatas]